MPNQSVSETGTEPVDELDAALESLGAQLTDASSDEPADDASTQDPSPHSTEETDASASEDADSAPPTPGEPRAGDPEDQDSASSSEEEPKLSRRQRAKLYEQFRQQSEQERAENDRLRQQIAEHEAEDQRRQASIDKALGTNADYQKALSDIMSSDPNVSEPAKKRYKIYTANREFYGQLLKGAERDINVRLARDFWSASDERPGIDRKFVQTAGMKEVLLHYYDQGAAAAEASAAGREEKLNKTIETLRGEIKELKASRVLDRTSPVRGGRPVTKDQTPLRGTLGDDGLPTDDAISAARNGRLSFLRE